MSDQGIHGVLIGHVAHIAVGFDPLLPISGQPPVHQLPADIIEADLCPGLGISGSDGKADSVGCPRYQRHFSFQ